MLEGGQFQLCDEKSLTFDLMMSEHCGAVEEAAAYVDVNLANHVRFCVM